MANDNTYNNLTLGLEKVVDLLLGKLPKPKPAATLRADGNGAVIAVRKDYELRDMPGPTEPRPAHNFTDVSSLSAWLKAQTKAGRIEPSRVDVLVSRASCVAMLDPWRQQGTSVCCTLDSSPAWARWGKVIGQPMNAADLLLLVRETSHVFAPIHAEAGGEPILVPGANPLLEALSDISIVTSGDFSVKRTATGHITYDGKQEKIAVSCQVPPLWDLRMAIYAANREDVRCLSLLLTTNVRTRDGVKELWFTFTCPLLEDVLRDARTALAARLQTELGEGWVVGQGEAKTSAVPVPVDDRVLA